MTIDGIRDYRLVSKLGEGGMGTVYLAEDTMLDRKVALKVLNPALTQDSQFVERFRQEARVQSSLVHPNVVSLYTFFHEGGQYCMVMEYAEGETLKQVIERTGPIPVERVLKIFGQMLDAAGHAHSRGIVHRDIKPGNVMLGHTDRVKVMDFGIAKLMNDVGMTKTGAKLGTLYYMSPEQVLAAKDIDHRTDIYSLGVTLYEMLTGRLPFDAEADSDFAIMEHIVQREFPDPREFYPAIPAWLANAVLNAVKKTRTERIPSTGEFKQLLLQRGTRQMRVTAEVAPLQQGESHERPTSQKGRATTGKKRTADAAPPPHRESPEIAGSGPSSQAEGPSSTGVKFLAVIGGIVLLIFFIVSISQRKEAPPVKVEIPKSSPPVYQPPVQKPPPPLKEKPSFVPNGIVTVPSVGMRSDPSFEGKVLATRVVEGERVEILRRSDPDTGPGWVKIRTKSGKVGWVLASVISGPKSRK